VFVFFFVIDLMGADVLFILNVIFKFHALGFISSFFLVFLFVSM
jgi:hypothetical protein